MKCPKCNEIGKILTFNYDLEKHEVIECPKCHGRGKKLMTNEEWFCGLSTEEKATFLAIQIRLGVEFYRTNDERYQNHDWWVEWLKQPHHESVTNCNE